MQVIYRPIERWERKVDASRPHSPFRAPYQDTLNLLEREARQLGARRVVVELAITEADLRLDGQPYAGTKPRHPGVIVAFESRHGPLKYTADKFATWTENLRAIALRIGRTYGRAALHRPPSRSRGSRRAPPGLTSAISGLASSSGARRSDALHT